MSEDAPLVCSVCRQPIDAELDRWHFARDSGHEVHDTCALPIFALKMKRPPNSNKRKPPDCSKQSGGYGGTDGRH